MTAAQVTPRPDEPTVLAGFLLAATGLVVAAGVVGAATGARGADLTTALGDPGAELLTAWMRLAVMLAVVAPCVVLAAWGRDPAVRRALLPYLGVLLVQVLTEATLPRLLPSWTVLVSGTLYTSFRLWQLRTSRTDLAARPATTGRRAARTVITVGTAFWVLNLAVLAACAVPLIES